MPSTPSEPESVEQELEEQAVKEPRKRKAKPRADPKLLAVEAAYPIKKDYEVRRYITPVGDDCFRVNFRSLKNGYVVETAYVEVTTGGELIIHDSRVGPAPVLNKGQDNWKSKW